VNVNTKRSFFNFAGETMLRFCSLHKMEGMVDAALKYKKKVCGEQAGCSVLRPVLNFEGHKGHRFCGQHELDGMVNPAVATTPAPPT